MANHFIVVEEFEEFWEGAIVSPAQAQEIEGRGAVLLPATPELFRASAVGGYFKRAWGGGWELPRHPALICPMLLFVDRSHHELHWCARLVRDVGAEGVGRFAGQVRMTPDTSQALAQRAGFMADDREPAVDLAALGDEDDGRGWIVRGRARVFASTDGYLGLGLYGAGPGLRVAWVATSLA